MRKALELSNRLRIPIFIAQEGCVLLNPLDLLQCVGRDEREVHGLAESVRAG